MHNIFLKVYWLYTCYWDQIIKCFVCQYKMLGFFSGGSSKVEIRGFEESDYVPRPVVSNLRRPQTMFCSSWRQCWAVLHITLYKQQFSGIFCFLLWLPNVLVYITFFSPWDYSLYKKDLIEQESDMIFFTLVNNFIPYLLFSINWQPIWRRTDRQLV